MHNRLSNLRSWCRFAFIAAGLMVACTDSTDAGSNGAAGNAGSGGSGGVTVVEGDAASEGGTVTEDATAIQNPDADGSAGTADAGGSKVEGGADASTGADAGGVACHVSWTSAATGGANCSQTGVCHRNFFSLHVYETAAPAPIKTVQLIFMAENELAVGTFEATGLEIVDTNIQTDDPGVTYVAEFDSVTHLLSGGTSMTLRVSSIEFSTDPNNVCSGVAHGSLDAVLRSDPAGNVGSKTLSVHADF